MISVLADLADKIKGMASLDLVGLSQFTCNSYITSFS